ncbi:MAG TPA: SRPBCC family protein [Candidatus Paceibacterota bacterium]|jgi:carbon monoxide dehydrogenase subunit G|nr:SRPBCC family protein [Candidatus Paceibacterota bacterium]HPN89439.1 SRPBCC family protein [Candidatus Paceibacterota bacterium]HPY13081.1 SRPBCC family protein [Candidatus Paceibacterota bacterium]HQB27117.1 SRPBCC family protein [Candidatus Paceibacterota bacterium]HQF41105.1 SRPBCC family protein [Candidatus Paceibacterota bacterium]
MKHIRLENSWLVKAPLGEVFNIITDFENLPKNFPKVAKSLVITKREGNHLEIDAQVKTFGQTFPVKMKTSIIPERGFISDNESPKFGTSGHEELLLEKVEGGTKINYVYEVDIHKKWLRVIAKPLIGWFAMKAWEKAVIEELRKILGR